MNIKYLSLEEDYNKFIGQVQFRNIFNVRGEGLVYSSLYKLCFKRDLIFKIKMLVPELIA